MKTITKLGIILCIAAGFSYAESFAGKLIDANCRQGDPAAKDDSSKDNPLSACAPTQTTTVFAIQTAEGKTYRLDSSGNAKAMTAMKNNPGKTSATVSGSLEGTTVKVESIDLR